MCIGDLLGLAEGLGKCGFFLDLYAINLWVKNGVEVRVDGNMDQNTDRTGSGYRQFWASSESAFLEHQRITPEKITRCAESAKLA
jgi:hypothetical protein